MIQALRCAAAVTATLCFLVGGEAVHAVIVVSWASSATSGSIASNAPAQPGVSDIELSRGAGVVAETGGSFYSSSAWDSTTLGAAITANEYIEWGFTSTQAYDLTSLDISYGKTKDNGSNNGGPMNIDIQVSINGGSYMSVHTDTLAGGSFMDVNQTDIDLSTFVNVTSAIFRLYGYNAENADGEFDIRDGLTGSQGIVVNGVASAVPEASSFVLGGLISSLVGLAYGRRKYVGRNNA